MKLKSEIQIGVICISISDLDSRRILKMHIIIEILQALIQAILVLVALKFYIRININKIKKVI